MCQSVVEHCAIDPIRSDAGEPRLIWVDVGRGLCILAVVAVHAQSALTRVGLDMSALDAVSVPLASARMPTFF